HGGAVGAAEAGAAMGAAGGGIGDVGGGLTWPGRAQWGEGGEVARVPPVVQQLAAGGTAVSIDTRKSGVMRAAIGAGAGMVNDVSGLNWDPLAAPPVAEAGGAGGRWHPQGR